MKTQKRTLLIWSIALLITGLLLFGSLVDGLQDDDLFTPLGLVFIAVGGLIAARCPENAIGWIFLAGVFLLSTNTILGWYAWMGLQERPGSLPGADVVAAIGRGFGNIGFGVLVPFPFLLFPNGRLLSRRWRPVLWLTVLVLISQGLETFRPGPLTPYFTGWDNPLGVEWLAGYFEFMDTLGEIPTTAVFLAAPLSLILRYRRATLTERQQIKWLAYSAGLFGLVVGLMLVISPILNLMQIAEIWFNLIWIMLVTSIPVSIGIAILRYRLYDIDLLIRRTLVYTVLTVTLALVYFGLVILLEGALRSMVGSSGQVATVISTLAVAALFTPLRRRVQDLIDRRFYRRKYNAEQALAGFAAAARDETDLEALSAQVVNIVQDTMQPDSLSLWIKETHQ